MTSQRHVLVPPERLPGWVERFAARNGGLEPVALPDQTAHLHGPEGGSLMLRGSNGCVAVLHPPWESAIADAEEPSVEGLVSAAASHGPVGLLLVRRGGYAVGVAENGKLIASKTGTKYVQSRTAAGGWSQQRFARRRANQASGLADAAATHAARLFGDHHPGCLQLGGDRSMASEALAAVHPRTYQSLPRLKFLVVPDPRLDILKQAAQDARSIRITITDPVTEPSRD